MYIVVMIVGTNFMTKHCGDEIQVWDEEGRGSIWLKKPKDTVGVVMISSSRHKKHQKVKQKSSQQLYMILQAHMEISML